MARHGGLPIGVSVFLLLVGTGVVYYVLREHGLGNSVPPEQIWKGLSMGLRAVVVAGFIASAYGLGGVVSRLTRKS